MAEEQPKLPGDWPEIRRLKGANRTGWAYFANLVKLMLQELGEEKTCELIGKLMVQNAHRYLLPGLKGFGVQGNDPWAIASYFKLATGDIIGYKAELIREGPKRVIYRLHPPCLWFPDLDIPHTVCQALGKFEEEACRIVNPKVRAYATHLMTRGDPYCSTLFEEVED